MTAPLAPSGGVSNTRILGVLAYLGGVISGVVLLIVEKHDRVVRFHAMQSVVTFMGVLVLRLALAGLSVIGTLLMFPFVAAVVGLWIFLMVKAWRGETYKLPYVGDFAEHLLK